MLFETLGSKSNPAVLFFHAMGVTGASRRFYMIVQLLLEGLGLGVLLVLVCAVGIRKGNDAVY